MDKTVVGVFDRFSSAEDAIGELEKAGVPRNDVSIVAKQTEAAESGDHPHVTAEAGTGAALGGVAGLILGLGALAIPGAGPFVAAGPLAAALASAGIGAAAGGLLGALAGLNVPEEDAHYYADAVRNGGALVIVQGHTGNSERVREVLNNSGARNVGDEETRSSEPDAPQMTSSGARIYEAGLEMNPRKSRFESTS